MLQTPDLYAPLYFDNLQFSERQKKCQEKKMTNLVEKRLQVVLWFAVMLPVLFWRPSVPGDTTLALPIFIVCYNVDNQITTENPGSTSSV